MKRAIVVLVVAVVAVVAVGAAWAITKRGSQDPPVPHTARRYIGVSVPGAPLSMPGVRDFAKATGTHPNLVSYYTPWYSSFDASAAAEVTRYGALPLIFLDSGRVPVRQIAHGPDPWLASYAHAVRAFGHPVALSFDSEFNGPWWLWAFTRVSAATYVAAWRQVVDTFRAAGATNVVWVWSVSISSQETTAFRPWWPGNSYVTWVGINGYWRQPGQTFLGIFAQTFAQVRAFTNRPVLITETGAAAATDRAAAVTELFQGVETLPGVLGFIYFDYDKSATHDYQLDHDPAALAAFRNAARMYR